VPLTTLFVVLLVGAVTGFLGGLFGKGGSALATPVLAALGIPAIVAVASPLPATVPGTLLAARQYARRGHVDRRVLAWSVGVGLPATLVGAWATRWIGAESLVVATDLLVIGLGVGILVRAGRSGSTTPTDDDLVHLTSEPSGETPGAGSGGAVDVLVAAPVRPAPTRTGPVVAVALAVGLVAGLLANSGGFLLAPLFLVVLKLPVRPALGTSLAVSAALAIPGTVAHAALGHIDWTLVLVFGAASVPLSAVGARTALRVDPDRLEVVFGAVLVVLATVLLVWG
jgi:uncharacterized membrane protein YfcA